MSGKYMLMNRDDYNMALKHVTDDAVGDYLYEKRLAQHESHYMKRVKIEMPIPIARAVTRDLCNVVRRDGLSRRGTTYKLYRRFKAYLRRSRVSVWGDE